MKLAKPTSGCGGGPWALAWAAAVVFTALWLAPGRVAGQSVGILKDDLPPCGAAASPDYLARVLANAGFRTTFLNCEELATRQGLSRAQCEVLILPYGASFPLKAADNVRQFLRAGGKLFTTGGYAFDNLLECTAAGWRTPPPPAPPPADHVIWRRTFRAEDLRGHGPLTFSCFLKAAKVAGEGMAYLAVYQYGKDGAVLEFIDFAKVTGTRDWAAYEHRFRVHPKAERIDFHAGLYRCRGIAWFDDARLVSEGGAVLLSDDFETAFDPAGPPSAHWARSDARFCQVQTNVFHSGSRALETRIEAEGPEARWLNTRHGRPADGLDTYPEQMGMFDADYLLERVVSARPASEQSIVSGELSLAGPLEGWAASGVTGFDAARWVPLLNGYDRYGRLRGAVGAMLRHSSGTYAGSSWAYFGVTNRNLFAESETAMGEALVGIVRSLARDTYLAWMIPESGCYRNGETVKLAAKVFNGGTRQRSVRLVAEVYEGEPPGEGEPDPGRLRAEVEAKADLPPGQARQLSLEWAPGHFNADFYYVRARLREGEEEIDRLGSGFVVWNPDVIAAGPKLGLRDNYLRLGKRPMFLFGTDDWGYVFNTRRESPLQWLRDMRQRRDLGVQIYENLQFGMIPPFTTASSASGEETLRKVDGIIQLAQKYQQVYFAGLLIGYNTAASAAALKAQAEFCGEFAKRYAGVPGLIHYLNGDLRCQLGPGVSPEWNQFLRERYGSTEQLRKAWGESAADLKLGELEAQDFQDWGRPWDDRQVSDLNQFRAWLIRRWHGTLLAEIREHDKTHLASSEFYQVPHQGVDVPAGIDGLDLCNFGYFDKPGADVARFPSICKYNDQRARGKSNGPGEYGVKTHPAWGGGKDYGYHITRTREEASELFLAIAHYSLGLGASRIHNWCWKDDADRVFPWGMVYPCDGVPKPIAYVHRNQSLLFRHFAPVYQEPRVYVLTPDNHRFGGGKWQVIEGILKAFELCLAAHVENLGTLNEEGLEIPRSAKVIFYPLPFCPPDAVYSKLLAWVHKGGVLYLSGDISFDESRRRSRTARLEDLCGVKFVGENYPNISLNTNSPVDQPCIRVEPFNAKIVKETGDGVPLVMENRLGKGRVLFTTDPIELHSLPERRASDLALYGKALQMAKVAPIEITPNDPLLHVFQVPLQDGGQVFVFFNTDQAAASKTVTLDRRRSPVTVCVERKRPALVWFDGRGALRAVEAQGECALGGKPIVSDTTRGIVMTLDGLDVSRSRALLMMPLQPGEIRLGRRDAFPGGVVETGEIRSGLWRRFEAAPVTAQAREMVIGVSADQVESLLLVCESTAAPRWRKAVERAMTEPASLP